MGYINQWSLVCDSKVVHIPCMYKVLDLIPRSNIVKQINFKNETVLLGTRDNKESKVFALQAADQVWSPTPLCDPETWRKKLFCTVRNFYISFYSEPGSFSQQICWGNLKRLVQRISEKVQGYSRRRNTGCLIWETNLDPWWIRRQVKSWTKIIMIRKVSRTKCGIWYEELGTSSSSIHQMLHSWSKSELKYDCQL